MGNPAKLWRRSRNHLPGNQAAERVKPRRLQFQHLESRELLAADVHTALVTALQGSSGIQQHAAIFDRIDSSLGDLYLSYQAYKSASTSTAFQYSDTSMTVGGQYVAINAIPSTTASALAADLQSLGGQLTGSSQYLVCSMIPIDSIMGLASLSSLSYARSTGSVTATGSVNTQGDQAMMTDVSRQYLNLTGTGVTVGVLSDSYNYLNGAIAGVLSGDLPGTGNPNGRTTPVNVLRDLTYVDVVAGTLSPGTDEGRAMLEIVHDIAPDASLMFATAWLSEQSFATNIIALQAAGANVIVDDVAYFSEPFFQDGVIAQAVDQVVSRGTAYYSAAGNQARQSFADVFRAGDIFLAGRFTSLAGAPTFAGGTALDFDTGSGVEDTQTFTMSLGDRITLSLQWDQAFKSLGGTGATSDLDIYVLNSANQVVGGKATTNSTSNDPLEIFSFTALASGTYRLMIVLRTGVAPSYVKYVNYGHTMTGLTFDTQSSTVVGHANSATGASVGAAYYADTPPFGTAVPVLEDYSSVGGTPIFFDTSGNRISTMAAPLIRNHPNFVGPDGADTTFFGFDTDGNGLPNFYGTSAAAPHVAALAALMIQAGGTDPFGFFNATPTQINSALSTTALDMGTAGYDYSTGWGLVRAPDAIAAITQATSQTLPATFLGTSANDVMVLSRNSVGVDRFVINGTIRFYFPVALLSSITANGGNGGADSLTVDTSGGTPLPTGGLFFNGTNSSTATLQIVGGALATVVISPTDSRSGSVAVTQASQTRTITYTGTTNVSEIFCGVFYDPLDTTSVTTKNVLVIAGTAASDTLLVGVGPTAGTLQVALNGKVVGTYATPTRMMIYGGTGNDVITVNNGVTAAAYIFGGDGNDKITGGGGKNVLIGGKDADTLYGAPSSENLFISGYTSFDDDPATALALLSSWETSGLAYNARGDAFLAAVKTAGAKIFDDGVADTLLGGSASDFYFCGTNERLLKAPVTSKDYISLPDKWV